MKNLVKYLLPAAVAAVTFASCTREQNYNAAPAGEMTIRVHASVNDLKAGDPETKTYIGNDGTHANAILWGTDEYMKLALTAGENTTFANSTDAYADAFEGDAEAMFEFSVTPETANEYVYQGLYPASAAATSSNTNAANYKVNLPAIQNAKASSYDPAAYIMVAKPETFTSVQTDWVASFRRGTALNKITLKNFASSVEINKVKITAEGKKLAGGRHFNLTTGESLEVYGTDATIEVLYATPLSGTSMDVWFTSWDTEIAEGEKLTIVAYTTDNKSYTKEITVPTGKTIKFQEGYLNTLGAKFDGIDPVNVSSLDGNYVILAENNGTYYALKGEASGDRIASVDYTGSTSSYSGDASLVWTIATSGSGYTIKNGSNFIGWTSGNYADLVAEASYDATKCLMGIDDNGNGTYKIYVAADATRILARNQSNAYFAFYTGSGYKDIILVPATVLEQVAIPTFDPAAGEVTSGTNVSISCATSGATIHYTVDGTDPTSSSATYSSPIEITATTTIKAIAVKDGMADSEIATATYSVASAGSVTLTSSDITAGDNTVEGTNNSVLAYRLGTGSNNGSLTFPAGYSSITFTLAGWATGTRSFSITNGTINGDDSLSPAAGSPSGTINAGFSTNYTGTEYTIVVDDPTQEVVFSGRRCVVWGFTAVPAGPVTPKVATPTISISGSDVSIACATDGATIWYSLNGANLEEYSAPIDISGSNEVTIEAFAQKTGYDDSEVAGEIYYAVNVYATTNGSVTAVPFAVQGDEVSLTVTPDAGYKLATLSVLDENDDAVAVANNKFTMPASPVFVTATFAAGNDGSLEHPYTVAEALAIINGYSDKEKSDSEVYVSGIIANVGNYNSTYHSVTYDISDDGANTNTLNIYSGHFVANTNFSSNDQISVNDQVIVYGYLYLYGSTKEMYQNNYIYSLNGITKALTLAAPTVTTNDSAKQITVAWTAATGTESTVSYVINCGTQSYNATAAGSHTFTMADYGTYNVSVEATASDAVSATVSTSAILTDPSSATPYYVKVSDLSTLSANDKVIIVNMNHNALPAFTSTSTISESSISSAYDSTNDRFSVTSAVASCAITLKAPTTTVDGKTVFKLFMSNNNYITKTGTSGTGFNPATTSTTVGGDWTLSMDSNGRVNVKNNYSGSTRCLIWRSGSTNKFGAYASSNVNDTEYYNVYLYKLTN